MPRVRGFLDEAVKEIRNRPGQTAGEIVDRLLVEGRVVSKAQDPKGSLVATLAKHHAEKPIYRQRIDGKYRYYPVLDPEAEQTDVPVTVNDISPSDVLTIEVPKECRAAIDAIAVLLPLESRAEAAIWLIRKGIESTSVT